MVLPIAIMWYKVDKFTLEIPFLIPKKEKRKRKKKDVLHHVDSLKHFKLQIYDEIQVKDKKMLL